MTSLPDWLEPLPDAASQHALDEWAIGHRGIPSLDLMELAGAGLARVVASHAGGGEIAIVCGKGNNGGDGLVAARHLREDGHPVRVLLLAPPEELSGDARTNIGRLDADACTPFTIDGLKGASVIVDAILGTGSTGAPRGPAAAAIAAVNRGASDAAVVACDVPSGVDASTGEVAGDAVTAQATVTFHAGKPGLWIAPGKTHSGRVTVIDIGIPARGAPVQPTTGLIRADVLGLIPRRGAASTKFTAGTVLVCGGSPGLTGAPCMASMAATRAGAGYVTVAAPGSLASVLACKLLEVMVASMPDNDGALTEEATAPVLERAARADSLVLGPGLGRAPQTGAFTRALATGAAPPLVLDADGLWAFSSLAAGQSDGSSAGAAMSAGAGGVSGLSARGAATVLTPHAGELARLLGVDSASIAARRLSSARAAAAAANAVVVLKGDDTLIVDPGGLVAISGGGAPALATAGSGDVLAGMIGAYLAKRLDAFTAACAAVYLHVAAARMLAAELGGEGIVAGDVIAALPRALARGG
jgi:NAD(P)H-hydrate epimerase